jgi:GNAT superfamily N-acetyltransferase
MNGRRQAVMTIECEIVEEPLRGLAAYGQIPIRYDVRSVFDLRVIDSGLGGFSLVERALAEPFTKDYDALRGEGPTHWATKWNLANWGLLSAVVAGQRVGGCVLAYRTAGLAMLEGRDDVVALWDLRVHPDRRGCGIGSRLFAAATAWAKKQGCRLLKAETQNINVPACRFYAAQGCVLGAVDRFAYAELPDEVQLIWHKTL